MSELTTIARPYAKAASSLPLSTRRLTNGWRCSISPPGGRKRDHAQPW